MIYYKMIHEIQYYNILYYIIADHLGEVLEVGLRGDGDPVRGS